MITEQQQELACLYAVGALSPEEAKAFESALAKDQELQKFVRELGEVTSGIAMSVPSTELPASLKKILAALPAVEKENIVRPDFSRKASPKIISLAWLPWAAAACLAVVAIVFYQQNSSLKTEFAALTGQSVEQREKLSLIQTELAELKAKDRLSQVRIAMLGSLLKGSPKAIAVSLWDSEKQDGILVVQNLDPLPADKDYQLWVIDPKAGAPVDAGVFTVDEKGNVRFRFKPKVTVNSADKFAVTMEKQGGVYAPQGKMVLAGTWL
ncbi:MAG: anti-sigma factor [Limisphaerales bacterium]